jgi:hypothetical protein
MWRCIPEILMVLNYLLHLCIATHICAAQILHQACEQAKIIQNHWVSGLCPFSDIILENTVFQKCEQFLSSGEVRETPTLLGSSENVIEVGFFQGTQQSRCLPPAIRGWKEIQLPTHHDFFRILDIGQNPS